MKRTELPRISSGDIERWHDVGLLDFTKAAWGSPTFRGIDEFTKKYHATGVFRAECKLPPYEQARIAVVKAAIQATKATTRAPEATDQLNRIRAQRRKALNAQRRQLEIEGALIRNEIKSGIRADLTTAELAAEAGAVAGQITDLEQRIKRAGAVSSRNANTAIVWAFQSLRLDWGVLTGRNPAKSRSETCACEFGKFVEAVFATLA